MVGGTEKKRVQPEGTLTRHVGLAYKGNGTFNRNSMAKNEPTVAAVTEEEEESYPLVYNMWVTTMNITVENGGQVILQTGKPSPWPPPQ